MWGVRAYFIFMLWGMLGFVVGTAQASECPFYLLGQVDSTDGTTQLRHYFTRVFETAHGPFHEQLIERVTRGPGGFEYHTLKRKVVAGPPRSINPDSSQGSTIELPSNPDSENQHFEMIAPALDRNLKSYELRRAEGKNRGWPTAFIGKLRAGARNTIDHSIWEWAVDPKRGPGPESIVSTVRYTLVPYGISDGELVADGVLVQSLFGPVSDFSRGGKTHDENGLPLPLFRIPDFEYLGIEVGRPTVNLGRSRYQGSRPVGSGLHVNIGSLFVDESLSPAERTQLEVAWKLQAAQWAHATENSQFNYYAQKFYFMVDPISRRAYRQWNYDPVAEYITDEGKGFVLERNESPPTIRKHGIEWLPVEWRPEAIESNVAQLEDGRILNKGPVSTGHLRNQGIDVTFADKVAPFSFSVEGSEVIGHLMHELASNPQSSQRVFESLRKKIALLEVHWQEALERDQFTQQRALDNYESVKKMVSEIELKMRDLASHPDAEVRRQVFLLVGSLMEHGRRDSDFLPVSELIHRYFPVWLLDESQQMRESVLYMFGKYPTLRQIYADSYRSELANLHLDEVLKSNGVPLDAANKLEATLLQTLTGFSSPDVLNSQLGEIVGATNPTQIGQAIMAYICRYEGRFE